MRPIPRSLPSSRAISVVLLVATIIAVGLGFIAAGDNVLAGDETLTRSIQGMSGPVVESLADVGNLLGSTIWAASVIMITLAIAAFFRAWMDVMFLAVLLLLRLVATILKSLFDSPRPVEELVEVRGVFDGMGYPSGHAVTASTMALGLSIIAWRWIPSRAGASSVIGLLMLLGMMVGWARVWSGAHWPSDVLGGFAFGALIVAVSVLVLQRQMRTRT